jgi:hypothetical protein
VFVFLNTGPANAVFVNVALPEVRATGIAMSIFVYHLLGDVPSPILIGKASVWTGSLQTALLLTLVAMAVSGAVLSRGHAEPGPGHGARAGDPGPEGGAPCVGSS